jgi:uncharacterized protein YhaN
MRILHWQIDGFGVFRDFGIEPLPPGLTVFWGPNEAGKSTLLAFLRGMLFGFPEGDAGAAHYAPIRGGRHGGRIAVEGGGVEIRVERRPGGSAPPRLSFGDGREAGEDDLRRLLGGINDRLYRSIFAFSLSELESLKSLSAASVREHLFSAAIAGAGRAARRVLRNLERESAELLPRPGDSRFGELARKLESLRRRIAAARGGEDRYGELLAREREAARLVQGIEARIAGDADALARLQLLIDATPLAVELRRLRAEHDAFEAIDGFPEGGEARLVALRESLGFLKSELGRLEAGKADAAARRGELAAGLDARLPALGDAVDRLGDALGAQRQRLQSITDLRERLAEEEARLAPALDGLGPEWTAERLREFQPPSGFANEARRHGEAIEAAARRLDEARRGAQVHGRAVEGLEARRAKAAAALGRLQPLSEEEIERREAACRRLRTNLVEQRAENAAQDAHQRALAELEAAVEALRAPAPNRLPVLAFSAAAAAGLAGIAGAVWRLVAADAAGGTGFMLLAALGAATAVLGVASRRRIRAEEARRAALLARRQGDLDAARDELRRRHGVLERLRGEIADDVAAVGLDAGAGFDAVDEKTAELRRERERRIEWQQLRRELDELEQSLEEARREEERLAGVAADAEARRRELAEAWDRWRAAQGFDAGLDPAAAIEFSGRAAAARGILVERDLAERRLAEVAQRVQAWEGEAVAALERAGDRGARELSGGGLIARFLDLAARSGKDRELRRRLNAIDGDIAGWQERVHGVAMQVAAAERARAELLAGAGAADEPDFAARAEVFRRRRELRAEIAAVAGRLELRLGAGERGRTLRAEIEGGIDPAWPARRDEIEQAIEDSKRERQRAARALREAEHARRAVEDSAELAELELEEQCLAANLAEAERLWQESAFAVSLLREGLDDFERRRQPRVLAEASRIFQEVTGGRYLELRQSSSGDDLLAVEAGGQPKPTSWLSRGTAEQLYLALRLALVEEYARGGVVLPVVMDDVLVNFDPERAESMARYLCRFAAAHQVIFFTCQPRTCELFQRLAPETAIRELGAGSAGAARPEVEREGEEFETRRVS